MTPTPNFQYGRQQYYIDDETIAEMIREKPFKKGTGKRQVCNMAPHHKKAIHQNSGCLYGI